MKYSETDLEILYNAKTLFYEIGHNDQPVKFSNTVGDNHGNLLHIGIRDGEYNICYYIFVDDGEVEECIAGQKLLLKILNNGNIEPIESELDTENVFSNLNESEVKVGDYVYIPNRNLGGKVYSVTTDFEWNYPNKKGNKMLYGVKLDDGTFTALRDGEFTVGDTENIFNQLGESIKRIIKEEMDEFEWAKESIKEYPYYRPEGRRPKVGEMIRIISKDNSWMGDDDGYRECFENPNDITVTVNQVGIYCYNNSNWLEVSFWCPAGQYDAEFYIPFSTEPAGGFRGMDYYGIKIMPHIS